MFSTSGDKNLDPPVFAVSLEAAFTTSFSSFAFTGADPDDNLATIVPTSTVSCSATKISFTIPSAGEGTSVSTLSVLISKIVSSLLTLSPTFLYHLIMVPSITDSPIFGIVISIIFPVPLFCCTVGFSSTAFIGSICSPSNEAAETVSLSFSIFSSSFLVSGIISLTSLLISPFPSIIATTVPTSTVSPSFTLISDNTPSIGDGISVSTLSVLISKIISSRLIVSPFFLCHLIMVPSLTLSPIFGIITSIFLLLILNS